MISKKRVDRVLKIMDRRARLNNLDAAISVGLHNLDFAMATNEQSKRIVQSEDPVLVLGR